MPFVPTEAPPPSTGEALNGFTHPYTGLTTVMTDEDADHQIAFIRDIVRYLDPQGPLELHFARTLALDNWRLTRIKTVEENLFAHGQLLDKGFTNDIRRVENAIGHAWSFKQYHRIFDKLSQYESRLVRNIERMRRILRDEQLNRVRPITSTQLASNCKAA